MVDNQVSALRNLWNHCRDDLGAYVIQHNLAIPQADPYGRLSASAEGGRGRVLREINLALWREAQSENGVAILDVEQIASSFGKVRWSDPVLWHTAKLYPAPVAVPTLVRHQTALLRAVLGLNAKCLVLDL